MAHRDGDALVVPELTPAERTHIRRPAAAPADGPVVYWMQHAQRAADNPALEHAVALASRWDRAACVVFGLDAAYPGASERSFVFMLEGLREVRDTLAERGVGFACRLGSPTEVALSAAGGAAALVCDRGYLRHHRAWRDRVAAEAPVGVVEIEGDVVVPVETASDKAEYMARTIRPKLLRVLDGFASLPSPVRVARPWRDGSVPPGKGEDVTSQLDDPLALARRLDGDSRAGSVADWFGGGARHAQAALERLTTRVLMHYERDRNQPQRDAVSYLGMHLHFGQVSPVRVLRTVRDAARNGDFPRSSVDAFVEELVVRRELAVNHAWYEPGYDRYEALPSWARDTLAKHAVDERERTYDAQTLEAGETADPYWNAAMREMRETGYMHNYMRMYWGKRILAWSAQPEAGFELTRTLNDRYFLDGRDPNSYAGVAWVYGRHDRPWPERAVFGTVRSMVAAGLRRKGDPDGYVAKVARRVEARQRVLDEHGDGDERAG